MWWRIYRGSRDCFPFPLTVSGFVDRRKSGLIFPINSVCSLRSSSRQPDTAINYPLPCRGPVFNFNFCIVVVVAWCYCPCSWQRLIAHRFGWRSAKPFVRFASIPFRSTARADPAICYYFRKAFATAVPFKTADLFAFRFGPSPPHSVSPWRLRAVCHRAKINLVFKFLSLNFLYDG